jgi:hypothetical protein
LFEGLTPVNIQKTPEQGYHPVVPTTDGPPAFDDDV